MTRSEWVGFTVLGCLLAVVLQISWLKWPDPIVDFGRELYLPWRLSQGAVLYRDVDANYGPLSHYFNALVFRVLGPGFLHLVAVNLALYAAILALLYAEVRAGWGALAAFAASAVFIVVFSFSQLTGVGNYNFAAPYSHETTHGFLFLLVLIALSASWLRRPHAWKAAAAGAVVGLCALLKIEIVFAASVVIACAVARAAVARRDGSRTRPWLVDGGPFVVAALAPPLLAAAALWKTGAFSVWSALQWANVGWAGIFIYKDIAGDPIQAAFLGTRDAAANLWRIALSGALSVAGCCAAAAACRSWVRRSGIGLAASLCVFAAAVAGSLRADWHEVGAVFPAWLGFAAVVALRATPPKPLPGSADVRWLLLAAAFALLVRMALNPRIYHYGYCQAALAGVVITATAFRTVPDAFALSSVARSAYLAALGAFVVLGMWRVQMESAHFFSVKTQALGEGVDRIYGYHPRATPTTYYLEQARRALSARPSGKGLLVLPEGVTLNYLLRRPSPSHVYNFNPYWLNWRESILEDLGRRPPDHVVLIGRDMREYGVGRFGESPEHGSTLMEWVTRHCVLVWRLGGDPLDVDEGGVAILARSAP